MFWHLWYAAMHMSFFLILAECVWTCWTSLEIFPSAPTEDVESIPCSAHRDHQASHVAEVPHVRGAHQRNLEATWLDKSWPGPSQETKETTCRFKLQEVHVATCDVSKYLYFFLHDTAKRNHEKCILFWRIVGNLQYLRYLVVLDSGEPFADKQR